MSARLSFYEIPQIPIIGLELLADRIEAERFTARKSSGFLITKQSKKGVDGRYVQKISSEDVFTDPLGKEHRQDTTYFLEQPFILRDSSPQLIVFNANPLLRTLTGRLSEFSDFRVSIKGMEWSPETLLQSLAKIVPVFRVYAVKVNNVRLSPAVEARLTCEGSSQDVRIDVRKFLRRKDVSFASLKVEFEYGKTIRKCEIRRDGALHLFGSPDPILTDLWIELVSSLSTQKSQPQRL